MNKMNNKTDQKEEILFRAEWLLYHNNLLIQQCNSWLSEEEGNERMMQQIREKRKLRIKN